MTLSIPPFAQPLPVLKVDRPVVVGHDVLPPELRAHIHPEAALDLWDPKTFETGWWKWLRLKSFTWQGVSNLAVSAFKLWQFKRFSDRIRDAIEEKAAPDTKFRMVFDAKGWMRFPMAAELARVEDLKRVLGKGNFPAHPSGVEEVDDAFDKGGFVFDFFRDRLGVVLPQPLAQVVNFNWDVTFTGFENAAFIPLPLGANLVIYGKGDGRKFHSPTRAIDVIGHELGHFYLDTVFPEKFPYVFQPGAINEHVADVIGICVKAAQMKLAAREKSGDFTGPYPDDFWLLGAGWMVQPGMGIRHMQRPGHGYSHSDYGSDTQPSHMSRFKVTTLDKGGVHANSGILNRVFARFSQSLGGDCFDIPLKVWLKALKLVRPSPTFRDFAEALLKAANDMDGYSDLQGLGVGDKMRAALDGSGIFRYTVVGDRLVRLDAEGRFAVPTVNDRASAVDTTPDIGRL